MLNINLSFLLSECCSVRIFGGLLFLWVAYFWFSTCLLEQFKCRHLVSSQSHVEAGTHLSERYGPLGNGIFCDLVTLEVPHLDGLVLASTCEYQYSSKLYNIHFFHVLQFFNN